MARGLMSLLPVVVASFLLSGYTQAATYDNLDALTTSLFASYKSDLRPFVDDSNATFVYMGIWLNSVQDLNEIDQSLTFAAVLYMSWTDVRLSWSPSSYNGTTYFAYPQNKLWIPDVTITNSMENMKELGFDRSYLYILDSGEVEWLPGGVYKTSCDIDITFYPFDTQSCIIKFSTLVSTSWEIDLDADPTYSTYLDQYSPSGTWHLVSFTTAISYDSSSKTVVAFEVKLRRLSTYYVVSIIFPVLFLSLTATLVFALPADSGEKMGTSITVLLAFAVYLTIVADQMPKTSLTVSVLSLYLSTLLAQTALGVVLSVWILNLHFREDDKTPPSRRFRSMAVHMQRLMRKRPWKDQVAPLTCDAKNDNPRSCLPLATTMESTDFRLPSGKSRPVSVAFTTSRASTSVPEMMSWKEVAVTCDRFLFYAFTIFLTSATVIFLFVLIVGGKLSG